ncbi:MAG: antibiotic biosynthesis monooxygenase [Thiobacillus sp.]|nr:antibiotic biosynthesis monooxygenase [Thiobacillus sp.]
MKAATHASDSMKMESAPMLTLAYRFPVLPRHHDPFRHAYRSARDGLQQSPGLVTHAFSEPRHRRDAFTLLMVWDSRASFERFTRTWIGVWLLNGMGFPRDAFAASIATDVGEAVYAPGKRGA